MSLYPNRPRRILLADDNDIDRRMLAEACSRLGWHVESVASGGELIGVVKVARERGTLPDCLLVDWYMPHLDGLATVNQLKEHLEPSEMPAVVLVTALDASMVELAEGEIGDHLILHKPVHIEDLLAVVDSAVGEITGDASLARSSEGAQSAPLAAEASGSGWPALRGIDTELARANVGDDIEFYEELCVAFINPAYEMIHQIEQLIPDDSRDELRQRVHKLRGQLGIMGARELQEKAGVVDVALVDGFTYQVDLEQLVVYIRALLIDMEEWVRKAP